MKKDVYRKCRAIIAKRISLNAKVISMDKCMNEAMTTIDFTEMEEDEWKRIALKSMLTSACNSNNYYSVKRRKGFFANIDVCRKAYIRAIIDNADKDINRIKKLLDKLSKRLDTAEIDGQMEFDFDTGEISEQITEEQILEMLEAEAE